MEVKLVLVALVATLACCVCLPTQNQLTSRRNASPSRHSGLGIYDGTPTTIEKHPSIVAIIVYSKFNCEGSIVSDSWVLTTADCIADLPRDAIEIIAGSQDGVDGTTYKTNTIVLNPNYGINIFDYEYGCLQIQGTFQYGTKVQPILLPSQEPNVGTNFVVAGWGDTAPSSEVGDSAALELNEGNMKWLSKKVCKNTFAAAGLTWSSRMACVYNKGKTTLCKGDFGNSFVYKNVTYGQFIAGLTSGFCTNAASPLLISDIKTEVAWIKKVTGAKTEDEI